MLGFSVEEDESRGKPKAYSTKIFDILANHTTHHDTKESVKYHTVEVLLYPNYLISEISKAFKIVIPVQLINLVQLLMDLTLPTVSTNVSPTMMKSTEISQSMIRKCPSKVRAFSFVTMGKFCLRDKTKARDHVNIFLRELHNTNFKILTNNLVGDESSALISNKMEGGSTVSMVGNGNYGDEEKESSISPSLSPSDRSSVRSNALLVLGDMCIRYTNLVDRHVGIMAACLQVSRECCKGRREGRVEVL